MRIGQVAGRAAVPAKTIRFWEEQGLLPRPVRTASGYRDYGPDVVRRLWFVRSAQAAGFRLDQIRQILQIGDAGEPPCQHVTQLIHARLADVEARIAELEATRGHLRAMAGRAAEQDPAECGGYCSIVVPPVAAAAESPTPPAPAGRHVDSVVGRSTPR